MQVRSAARLRAVTLLFAAAMFCGTAQAQSASKLVLTVTPLGAAAADKAIPVSATVGVNITLKNESSEPLSKVLLTAKLNGAKLTPESDWKADGF